MSSAIPVTIVSGGLGAGKTTLLNHLLEGVDRRLAVLVNDMGEVNVDAELLEGTGDLAREGIAELSNGCICCELQDDLEVEVKRLARRYDFDHLVVESSGISEPAPVARLFTANSPAAARYEVDALVTVVDAAVLADAFAGESIERETDPEASDRPLSDLLIEQIEVSNVVLLNKCDLLDDDELDRLEGLIAGLQPDAEVIRTVYSEVDPDRLFGRGLFDPAELGELAGWQRALQEARAHEDHDREGHEHEGHEHEGHDHADGGQHHRDRDDHGEHHDHRSPESVYGVESTTYRRRRPFDPDRFRSFLRDLSPSIVRAKGTCWIAGEDDLAFQLHVAGRAVTLEATEPWVASLPESRQTLYRSSLPDGVWDESVGDRRTELVFIGQDLDAADLEVRLDECLVDDGELDGRSTAFETGWLPAEGDRVLVRD